MGMWGVSVAFQRERARQGSEKQGIENCICIHILMTFIVFLDLCFAFLGFTELDTGRCSACSVSRLA